MPNIESASEKLMASLTIDMLPNQLDFFTNVTTAVWAEGKNLEKAIEEVNPTKYLLDSDEVEQVRDAIRRISFVHAQETEANFAAVSRS